MTSRFQAAVQKVAAATPMGRVGPIVQGRTLHIDGDGLAYWASGAKGTDPGSARFRLMQKIDDASRAAGAERVRVFITHPASVKGGRYAVARAKPYQANRAGGKKPENWAYLRTLLEEHRIGYEVLSTITMEADDLFAMYQTEDTVIMSEDKDMRMIPGWHLTWHGHLLRRVENWIEHLDDKLYGHGWFWHQVLQGDAVDNIPGLPGIYNDREAKTGLRKVGPKKAEELLDGVICDQEAAWEVLCAYENYYGVERALVELLEQGVLLWMRRSDKDLLDVAAPGGPMEYYKALGSTYKDAAEELLHRVQEARRKNAEAQAVRNQRGS